METERQPPSDGKPKTLADLPTEIIASILHCLTEVRDLKEAVVVCRLWNQLASKHLYLVDAEQQSPKSTSWALKEQSVEAIRRIIRFGADRFDMDSVRIAAGLGHVNFVKEVLKSPRFLEELRVNPTPKRHAQPLIEAIKRGHFDMAVLLVESGIDVDQTDSFGEFPLHMALRKRHFTLAEMLLDRGAEAMPRGSALHVRNALSLAVQLDHTAIVKRILDSHPPQDHINRALSAAVESGFTEMVRLVLEAGGDANSSLDLGGSLIRGSAILGDAEIFKMLVEHGAVIDNRLSSIGLTLLHQVNHADMVKLIVQRGVPVDALSSDSVTPLIMALGRRNSRVAEALLDAGADPKVRTVKGKTTLDLAITGRMLDLVYRLKKCGVSTSEKDPWMVGVLN